MQTFSKKYLPSNTTFMRIFLNLTLGVMSCIWVMACNEKSDLARRNIAGIINTDTIFVHTLDSMIYKDIYKLRVEAFRELLNQRILVLEAQKRGVDIDDLLSQEVQLKSHEISNSEIMSFVDVNPVFIEKEEQVLEILRSFKYQERLNSFIDSLNYGYKQEIFLLPPYEFTLATKDLYGFDPESNKYFDVFMIFSFDCSFCIEKLQEFHKLEVRYSDKVRFKLVYLNHSYGIEGKGFLAANRQGHAWEFIAELIDKPQYLFTEDFYLETAKNLGLNYDKFLLDFTDQMLLKDLLKTRDVLFGHGVYSTPFFIINSRAYDGNTTIPQIERLIIEQLYLIDKLGA